MSANGDGAPPVETQPVAFSFKVERVGTTTLDTGDTVPILRLVLFMPTGRTELFMPAPFGAHMADQIREAAGGLTIVHDLEGIG
jgi:hypothetical protein